MRKPQKEGNELFCGNCGAIPPKYYCRDCGFLLCQNCVFYEVPNQKKTANFEVMYPKTNKQDQLIRQCKACKSKNVYSIQEELESLPHRVFNAILPIIAIYEKYNELIHDYSIQCYETYAYRQANLIAFPEIEIHLEQLYKYLKKQYHHMNTLLIKFRKAVHIQLDALNYFHEIPITNIPNAEDAIKIIQSKVDIIERNLREIQKHLRTQKEKTKPIYDYLAEQLKLIKIIKPFIDNEPLGSIGILGITEHINLHVKKPNQQKKGEARILFMDFEMVLFFKRDHEILPVPWALIKHSELKYNTINGMQLKIQIDKQTELIIKATYATLKTIYRIIQKIQNKQIKHPDKNISQTLGNKSHELLLARKAEEVTSAFHTKIFAEKQKTRIRTTIPTDPREIVELRKEIFGITKTLEDLESKLEKGLISPEAYAKSYRALKAQLYPLLAKYEILGGNEQAIM